MWSNPVETNIKMIELKEKRHCEVITVIHSSHECRAIIIIATNFLYLCLFYFLLNQNMNQKVFFIGDNNGNMR